MTTIPTVTGTETVIKELHGGAVMIVNGCTAMIQRPDGSCAFVNRNTARALVKRPYLFITNQSGPSEWHYRLSKNGIQVHRQNVAQGIVEGS